MHLTVFGATGFLGSWICREALKRGHRVTGISRHRPHGSKWMEKLEWQQGNALEPHTYRDVLKESDVAIHSIGQLFNNSMYKVLLNQRPTQLNAFEANHDTAVRCAQTFAEERPDGTFCFISASGCIPEQIANVGGNYITAKRQAEEFIQQTMNKAIILRPGLLYDESRPVTMLLAGLNELFLPIPPLRCATVAEFLLDAIEHNRHGIFEAKAIRDLNQ